MKINDNDVKMAQAPVWHLCYTVRPASFIYVMLKHKLHIFVNEQDEGTKPTTLLALYFLSLEIGNYARILS